MKTAEIPRAVDRDPATPGEQSAWAARPPGTAPRFVALDSWRGIAACFVAAFHAGPSGHLQDAALLRQAYYFVDFFFVLSGFVIAANYGTRLVDRASLGRFLVLRLGRLYPLHLAMLAAFVGLEVLKFLPGLQGVAFDGPFSTPQSAPETIITNLLLLHSLGLHESYSWNTPSWSISTEFYTYLLFGIAVLLLRRRVRWLLLAAVLIAPILLAALHGSLAADYDYGLIRCVFGFAAGALSWQVYLALQRRWGSMPLPAVGFTLLEITLVGVLVLAIGGVAGARSLALPYLFALAVILFAYEGGAVSRALKHPWPVLLGALSYSIYMTHVLVKRLLLKAGDAVERLAGIDLIRKVEGVRVIGPEPWQGDLHLLVYLAAVIGLSYCTYRLIELPARGWSRSLVTEGASAWQAAGR